MSPGFLHLEIAVERACFQYRELYRPVRSSTKVSCFTSSYFSIFRRLSSLCSNNVAASIKALRPGCLGSPQRKTPAFRSRQGRNTFLSRDLALLITVVENTLSHFRCGNNEKEYLLKLKSWATQKQLGWTVL